MLNKAIKPPEVVKPIPSSVNEDMEQLGLMASSIAHDFNNLLTNIMGHMSLALLKTNDEDDSRLHIERAVKTAEYAAALTSQLLDYSRNQSQTQIKTQQIEYIDVNDVVREVLSLVEVVSLTGLDIEINLNNTLPRIVLSEIKLQQVVMNLLINAAESIDDPTNGVVKISTGKYYISSWENSCDFINLNEMAPGDYVFLQISDNGKGIKPEVRARIFDPFFSTKPKGRGLGLSTIIDIVKEHHGYIKVKSDPGVGTMFRIYFPISFTPIH